MLHPFQKHMKYNSRLRKAKMGMLMSKWAWNPRSCPRQFKSFFSRLTRPKVTAIFKEFLQTHRRAQSSALYGEVSATNLFIFLA